MMKYVNNALLATLISTINEYSNIARAVENINFEKVMQGVHLDNRWSPLISRVIRLSQKLLITFYQDVDTEAAVFQKM